MIERVVTRRRLHDRDDSQLHYWLSRPPAERIAHVEELRAEYYGWTDGPRPRLQRVHRVLRRT